MFSITASPSKWEPLSTSTTDHTSSSHSENTLQHEFEPSKDSTTDLSNQVHAKKDETASPSSEPFEEEYCGLWPKERPGYTRRLIPMILIPLDEINENFDEDAWNKKAYGPDVIIVDRRLVPKGWVLVDGNAPSLCLDPLLMIDPSPPPPKKIKKTLEPFRSR
jgi:hypothetical protein